VPAVISFGLLRSTLPGTKALTLFTILLEAEAAIVPSVSATRV
jgi:hypothetical protein